MGREEGHAGNEAIDEEGNEGVERTNSNAHYERKAPFLQLGHSNSYLVTSGDCHQCCIRVFS